MNRKTRVTKKNFKVFCEGDTEYNYIDEMRRQKRLSISLKLVNMKGGGYSDFLEQVKFVVNNYSISRKQYEIKISTIYTWEKLGEKGSNINEFFEVVSSFNT